MIKQIRTLKAHLNITLLLLWAMFHHIKSLQYDESNIRRLENQNRLSKQHTAI